MRPLHANCCPGKLPESTPTLIHRALNHPLVLTIALFMGIASASEARGVDRIWQTSGGRPVIADSVTVDHYDTVAYRKGGTDLSLPGIKVRAIDYGNTPESFLLGIDKRDEGDYENAISLLKSAMSEKGVGNWINVRGPFEVAETLRLWGATDPSKYSEAIAYYDQALNGDSKTRIRPEILFGRASANLGAANLDQGLADLELLAKEGYENKYGVRWELRAALSKAEALDDAGRADDAKRAYSRLQTSARSFAGQDSLSDAERALATEMAGLARLAQGKVLIRNGKAAEAESFFRGIVEDSREAPAVQAVALVGAGEALQAQKKLKDAQMTLATVRIRYFGATEAVAEATFRLGLVTEELGDAEPKGRQLARDYYTEVFEKYSGSRWAQKAREKMN